LVLVIPEAQLVLGIREILVALLNLAVQLLLEVRLVLANPEAPLIPDYPEDRLDQDYLVNLVDQ